MAETKKNVKATKSDNISDNITLEEKFNKLDEIVSKLETADVSLEESFELYKQGMEFVKECSEELNLVEKKVLQIRNNGETDEF